MQYTIEERRKQLVEIAKDKFNVSVVGNNNRNTTIIIRSLFCNETKIFKDFYKAKTYIKRRYKEFEMEFAAERSDVIDIARELCYPESTIVKLMAAKTVNELDRIMNQARNSIK